MPEATFHFPHDFRWGVATAAHQVEGNNANNDWWAWEQQPGHIAQGDTSGLACTWWEDAEADVARAAALGTNALRLSVEWSRVEPQPGTFDDGALGRYVEMVEALRERGIEPMVTLHHFTNPRWLAEQGGWERPETVDRFARFVERVVEALGRPAVGEVADDAAVLDERGLRHRGPLVVERRGAEPAVHQTVVDDRDPFVERRLAQLACER